MLSTELTITNFCKYVSSDSVDLFLKNSQRNFILIHQNIHSFDSNFVDFSTVFDQNLTRIDALVFSETWFQNEKCVDLAQFNSYHCTRIDQRGGGVSIYIRNYYKSRKVVEICHVSKNVEICAVEIFDDSCLKTLIIGLYRPPSGNFLEFSNKLNEILESQSNICDKIFLVGDFNLDYSSNAANVINLKNLMSSFNFFQLIDKKTRMNSHSSNCGSIIDHIWINFSENFQSIVMKSNISDHYTIGTKFLSRVRNSTFLKSFRDHSNSSINALKIDINNLVNRTKTKFSQENLDLNYELSNFVFEMGCSYDKCCPIRKKSYSIVSTTKPWIDDKIKKVIKFKHFLYNEARSGYIPNYIFLNFKKKLGKLLDRSKSTVFQKKFNDCKSSKETWKNINFLSNRSRVRQTSYVIKNDQGIIVNDEAIAGEFSNFFSNIASDLDRNIPSGGASPISYMNNPNQQNFSIPIATTHEIKTIIIQFPNKGCSVNEIPVYIYKVLEHLISGVLCYFFNKSVTSGNFPTCLKTARVIPIYKGKGDSSSVNNFRPISILPIISKIFEKLMYARLNRFLSFSDILVKHQFGFRQNRSTSDAIIEFLDHVYNTINASEFLIAVFLDLSKAFDTVCHSILLNKLSHYGIRGKALDWFKSYLTNRSQFVQINNSKSHVKSISSGVPQGSVLGPLLFLIYVNDMYLSCKHSQVVHFADDTTCFDSNSNLENLSAHINADLNNLYLWLNSNRLSLNILKTNFMIFGNKQKINAFQFNICISNQKLSNSECAKFLGVFIDADLNFKYHVDHVVGKINSVCGVIWKYSRIVPRRVLKQVYFSLAYSYLSYGVVVFGRSSLGTVNKLQRIQDKLIKRIHGSSSQEIYCINGIFNFKQIYNFFTILKFYREINSTNTESYFKTRIFDLQRTHSYPTRFRANNCLVTPQYLKNKCFSSFLYNSIKVWNSLPLEVREIRDFDKFKRKYKTWILSQIN